MLYVVLLLIAVAAAVCWWERNKNTLRRMRVARGLDRL